MEDQRRAPRAQNTGDGRTRTESPPCERRTNPELQGRPRAGTRAQPHLYEHQKKTPAMDLNHQQENRIIINNNFLIFLYSITRTSASYHADVSKLPRGRQQSTTRTSASYHADASKLPRGRQQATTRTLASYHADASKLPCIHQRAKGDGR